MPISCVFVHDRYGIPVSLQTFISFIFIYVKIDRNTDNHDLGLSINISGLFTETTPLMLTFSCFWILFFFITVF